MLSLLKKILNKKSKLIVSPDTEEKLVIIRKISFRNPDISFLYGIRTDKLMEFTMANYGQKYIDKFETLSIFVQEEEIERIIKQYFELVIQAN